MPKKPGTYTRYLRDPQLEPYFIQLEDYGFTLHKNLKSDTREYSQKIGHYTHLPQVIKALARDQVMNKSYDSLKMFIKEYNEVVEKLNHITNI